MGSIYAQIAANAFCQGVPLEQGLSFMDSSMGCRMCLPPQNWMPLHFGFSMRRFVIRRTACKGAAAKCFICSPPRRQPFPRRQPKRTRLIRARPFPRTNGMSPLYLCLILSRARGKDYVNIFHITAISAMVGSWISSRLQHLF